MNPPEKILITAYHGTTSKNAASIIKSNFKIKPHPEDWLGHGVYFFIEGVSCPIGNAAEWAKNKFPEEPLSTIRATIEAPLANILNLTTIDGLRAYNNMRHRVVSSNYYSLLERRNLKIKKRKDIRLDDQIITNIILEELNVKVLIHNVYIKNKKQRELALESSYPSTTVCSVNDTTLIKSSEIFHKHHHL